MKKQIRIRLQESEKKYVFVIIILLMTISFACQKEISTSIDQNTPPTDTPPPTTQIMFQKTYGGIDAEYVGDVQQTSDSGYVIIGTTSSYGAGDEDIYVIKTNAIGNMQWTKTYGGASMEEGYNIRQTSDGGYILGGVSDGFENYFLIKTDAKGNIQWNKAYGSFAAGYYKVQQTIDGGYIVIGPETSVAGSLCIKTDENGDIAWCKRYSGGKGVNIVNTSDGGYAIVAFDDIGYGCCSIQLIKIDGNGNLLWAKNYGGGYDPPLSLIKTTDGGFIITGMTSSLGVANNYDVYVLKTDANGNQIWFKTYGGTKFDGAWQIEQTIDGGYIFSGGTGNFGEGHVLVIKTDSIGSVTWSKTFGGGKETYSFVHQTKDGGYILASETSAFGAGSSDIYLIKIDSNGNSGCNEDLYKPTVSTPGTFVTNSNLIVSTGSTTFIPVFSIGTGGAETTICYK